MFSFRVQKKLGGARLSKLTTPHGTIQGPFFQFVATQAAIRGMVSSEDLEAMGVQIVLANTYHLHLRPGEDVIAEAGGLHNFMQWDGPITTDSGGYQVFSLGDNVAIDNDGVTFRASLDGSLQRFTPESVIKAQAKLGADIIMPLDVCTRFGATHKEVECAVERTTTWARRCKEKYQEIVVGGLSSQEWCSKSVAQSRRHGLSRPCCLDSDGTSVEQRFLAGKSTVSFSNIFLAARNVGEAANAAPQALYGIVQGGVYPDLRERAAAALREIGFFGYCIGGELQESGEKRLKDVVSATTSHLPEDAPRYLMGYGQPEDIVEAVRVGVDQFDCVLPVRGGRHGQLYCSLNEEELTSCLEDPDRPVDPMKLYEKIDVKKARYARDSTPFSPGHPVLERKYTKAYIHHLMRAETPSGIRFCVLHNIYFYVRLMRTIRGIIMSVGE